MILILTKLYRSASVKTPVDYPPIEIETPLFPALALRLTVDPFVMPLEATLAVNCKNVKRT